MYVKYVIWMSVGWRGVKWRDRDEQGMRKRQRRSLRQLQEDSRRRTLA
jgi:hypothetical protein